MQISGCPISNSNKICETVYWICENVHICFYVNQAFLYANKAKIGIFKQILWKSPASNFNEIY
jgi:hypothetical protein